MICSLQKKNFWKTSFFLIPVWLYVTGFSQSAGTKNNLVHPMNICRAFHSMAENKGKIYVFGGSTGEQNVFRDTSSVEMYDPTVNQWKIVSDMPEAITTSCAVSIDNKIFVIGGQKNIFRDRVKSVFMYDCVLKRWYQKSPMNIPRAFHSVVVLNNKIYAIGGRERPEEIGSKLRDSLAVYTIEEYDPVNDKWIIKSKMPFKHFTIGAVTIKDKIYILSDTTDNNMLDESSVLEEYDPVNNQFKMKTSLSRSRCDAAMVSLNSRIFVLGGWHNGALSFVDEYNPESGVWTIKSELPYVVQNHQAVIFNNKIFINGGIVYSDNGNQKKKETFCYNPENDKGYK